MLKRPSSVTSRPYSALACVVTASLCSGHDVRPVPPWAGRRDLIGEPPDPPIRSPSSRPWPPRHQPDDWHRVACDTPGRPGRRHAACRPADTSRRGYTSATVPIAVIAFDFDPLVRLGSDLSVRWQTLALAVVVLFCLAAAGILARRRGLRADDLLYVVIGAAPGAIIGGRIGYALLVPEAFSAGPLSLLDPSVGGLELGTAVAGGIGTAAIVATLLGSPVGAWAHIASIPLLTAIGAGKLTMVLGGSGQGRPFDGDWATAYVGAGAVGRGRGRRPIPSVAGLRGGRDGARGAPHPRRDLARRLSDGGWQPAARRARGLGCREGRRVAHLARPRGRRWTAGRRADRPGHQHRVDHRRRGRRRVVAAPAAGPCRSGGGPLARSGDRVRRSDRPRRHGGRGIVARTRMPTRTTR